MGRYEPAGFTALTPFAGTVYLFRSEEVGLNPVPALRLQNDLHGGFATAARMLGDVNGDGFDDFGIGGSAVSTRATLDIYYGSDHRLPSVPDVSYERGPASEYLDFFEGVE
jgi:hypothetical protein